VYSNMGEYSTALSFYEKTKEIFEKILPPNHPLLAASFGNIASGYEKMNQYPKALSFYERALNILKISLPANHPELKLVEQNIEIVKKKL
jgi:tetratricopeptide (TPR) repeat protein